MTTRGLISDRAPAFATHYSPAAGTVCTVHSTMSRRVSQSMDRCQVGGARQREQDVRHGLCVARMHMHLCCSHRLRLSLCFEPLACCHKRTHLLQGNVRNAQPQLESVIRNIRTNWPFYDRKGAYLVGVNRAVWNVQTALNSRCRARGVKAEERPYYEMCSIGLSATRLGGPFLLSSTLSSSSSCRIAT